MKQLLRSTLRRVGLHAFTDGSLPTGVDWLHDIRRTRLVGDSPLCFDVGANVGQTVLSLRERFPAARIHAFEPFEAPRRELLALAHRLPNVQVVALALGAQCGTIEVEPRLHSVLNTLVPAPDGSAGGPAETIRIDTVDRYCAELAIEHIDILKTDTEGFDLSVLQGAAAMLKAGRITYVYSEMTFDASNRQNTPAASVIDFLAGHGYVFLGLYETYPLHNFAAPNLFCNGLFVDGAARQRSVAQLIAAIT